MNFWFFLRVWGLTQKYIHNPLKSVGRFQCSKSLRIFSFIQKNNYFILIYFCERNSSLDSQLWALCKVKVKSFLIFSQCPECDKLKLLILKVNKVKKNQCRMIFKWNWNFGLKILWIYINCAPVRPYLEHCVQLWVAQYMRHMELLETVQWRTDEIVESPALEIFKICMYMVLGNWL